MENITNFVTNSILHFSGGVPNVEQNLQTFLEISEQFIKQYPQQVNTIMFVLQYLKAVGATKQLIDNRSRSEEGFNR